MNNNEIQENVIRMQLYNIRKNKMTQSELSKISGLSIGTISSIENINDKSPTFRSLMKYATSLGVELYIDVSKVKSF